MKATPFLEITFQISYLFSSPSTISFLQNKQKIIYFYIYSAYVKFFNDINRVFAKSVNVLLKK